MRGCRVVTTSLSARLLLARQLAAIDDVEWTVVSGDDYDDAPPAIDVVVVRMRREPSWSDLGSFFSLVRFFRHNRFDFVQTHTPKASFLALPAARLARQRALYTVHGSLYFSGNGRLANLLGWCFERWCCAWADGVLVQSREDEEVMPAARLCRAGKLSFVGNGIDVEHFATPVPPALPAGRPVVLMVSRLVADKGCRDFIALARKLSDVADWVHVGPTEHDQRDALSTSEISAASDVVRFVGPVDDVRPYLASATVAVLPSYREGIPRAAMEAAVAGVPVAAYDIRGVREVIPPGSGLLARRGDIEGLASVVRRLLEDEDRRSRAADDCRGRVLEQFSESEVVARLRRVYRDLDATAEA